MFLTTEETNFVVVIFPIIWNTPNSPDLTPPDVPTVAHRIDHAAI